MVTGVYTLYTVPSGKKLILNEIFMRVTSYISTTGTSPDINIGTNAAEHYNNWASGSNLINMSAVGINTFNQIKRSSSSPQPFTNIFSSGNILKLSFTRGAQTDDYNFALDLFGYLVDS